LNDSEGTPKWLERLGDEFGERKLSPRWINRKFDTEYWIETFWVLSFLFIGLIILRYLVWVLWNLT
jgi:hypothetical protein